MKSYKQFLEFVNKYWWNFIFLAVFYSLWVVHHYLSFFDPQLHNFSGRMIGEATLNAYDINQRIVFFYNSGFIFFFFLASFLFVFWRISSVLFPQILKSSEIHIINYTSLAGITFYFFDLWTPHFASSLELIYCLHKIALVVWILKYIFLKASPVVELVNAAFISIVSVLGVAVFFLVNETAVLFKIIPRSDFFATIFTFVIFVLIGVLFVVKKKSFSESKAWMNQFAYLCIPIALIPLGSFFKDELYLVLNRHQVNSFTPGLLYIIFLLIIFSIIFCRWKRLRKQNFKIVRNNEQLLGLRYFPILVISLSTFLFYNPFIEFSNEMFEAGNRILPLMEFQKFGVIPIFEKFNSHVLSDIFMGGIYTFFNGLNGREIFIYDFVLQVLWAFLVYCMIYKLSRNAYVSLFVILFFPIINSIIIEYTFISLITVFALDIVIHEKPSFKNYFIFILTLAFLFMWRIDIGYPSILASVLVLLVYLMNREQFLINWNMFFKTIGTLISLIIFVLIGMSWYREMNVFEKLLSGLNYLASAQTYGLSSIGDERDIAFKMQYFIFPIAIIVLMGYMIAFYKKYNISRSQRFIYLSFLFIIFFYFVNFQRGLVRHSFIEGHDVGVSSFSFFILSGCIFMFYRNKSIVYRLIMFLFLSTFLIINYKYPVPKNFENVFSKAIIKMEKFPTIQPLQDIDRCIDTTDYDNNHYNGFVAMCSRYLKEKQTFIDFSNSPMLYYLTGKESPSYFYQNPLTLHNENLQNGFIKNISKYDAPLMVFSSFPKNWYDIVDGVPNTIRHYRLSEYFYQHYSPFAIVSGFCIWKKNDFKIENTFKTLFYYDRETDSVKTGIVRFKVIPNNSEKLLTLTFHKTAPEINFISRGISSNRKPDYTDDQGYKAFYIITDPQSDLFIEFHKNESIRTVEITQSQFIPDLYSSLPKIDDLKQLPYIWANFDSAVLGEKIIQKLCPSDVTLAGTQENYFNINPLIDKTCGNTVFISLEVANKEFLMVNLIYGNKKNGDKGGFKFIVPPGNGVRNFAIRVSSQYNWYDSSNNFIALKSESNDKIIIKTIDLLKAE